MAPMSNQSINYSSNYGEELTARVNVLASCYVVDSAANLKGLHYCTTGVTGKLLSFFLLLISSSSSQPILTSRLSYFQGRSGIPEVPSSGLPSPPSSPPLAALTSSNQLALLPKQKKRDIPGRRLERRGGAALMIREECERFFCETMKTVFLGERNLSINGSGFSGAYLQSPPPDSHLADPFNQGPDTVPAGSRIDAWMEVWDYAGGSSFRAFVADDGREKSLFIFFDIEGVLGRDLKKALMALIELADGPLACSQIVTCLDRRLPADNARDLIKSLQWVGFDMATLDHWANDLDVTSKQWIFMGMEL